MSFTATVENGVIKLPEHTHLPNGSTVRVELVEHPRISPEVLARLKAASGRATTGLTTDEIMIIEGSPISPNAMNAMARGCIQKSSALGINRLLDNLQ